MSNRLDNYLKTYRKQAGLSQKELAYLLGATDGTKTSRYERFVRIPTLETALAYEAALGVPVRELFAGMYQRAEDRIIRRAKLLERRLIARRTSTSARKLHKVAALARGTESESTLAA